MTEDEFWQLIDAAGAGQDRRDSGEAVALALTDLLATRDADTIVEFQQHFDRAHDTLAQRRYWAAGYIIGGGCSDDAFMDFRAGVVALGRQWYQRIVADPDCLAEHEEVQASAARGDDDALFAEPVLYAANDAYEQVTGQPGGLYERLNERHALRDVPDVEPDADEDLDFDDSAEMHRRLPRLAALYGWSMQ